MPDAAEPGAGLDDFGTEVGLPETVQEVDACEARADDESVEFYGIWECSVGGGGGVVAICAVGAVGGGSRGGGEALFAERSLHLAGCE